MARSSADLIPLEDLPLAKGSQAGPRKPLFGDDKTLLRVTVVVWLAITLWKIVIAATGNVIWEEAHFAVLGQHPAWGYADVPAGWPLFARLITSVFGWSPLALRLGGLAVAQATPLGVWFLARSLVERREALWAALLSMLIPALTASGTVFYPEGALQLLTSLMLGCAVRAMRSDTRIWWALTGVCGALGLFIHYRFIMVGAGVVVFSLVSREGRQLWRYPGFYIAGLIAALGLLPGVVYNIQSGWPTYAYQVANRPATGQAANPLVLLIAFVVQQAGLTTPVFFVGLLAGGWRARRWAHEGDAGAGLAAWTGAVLFGFYLALSPVDRQIMPHWPFMAYVAWVPFLPGVLIAFADRAVTPAGRGLRATLIALGPVIALLGGVAGTVFQLAWADPDAVPARYRGYLFSKLEDWRQMEPVLARARAEAIRRFGPGEPAIAAAGHVSALRLEFPGAKGRQVYALSEPYDEFSRFGVMRSQWGLDEAGLRRAHSGGSVILVLPEPTYLYHTRNEADFRRRLCGEFADIMPVALHEMPPGRTAVEVYVARVRPAPVAVPTSPRCPLFPELYLAQPVRAALIRPDKLGNQFGAAADPNGIKAVDVMLDGRLAAHARYGLDPSGGRVSDVLAFDPNYPRVQFDFRFPATMLTPGAHRVWLRATRSDGSVIQGAARTFYVP